MENFMVFLVLLLVRVINLVEIFYRIFNYQLDLTFIHVFNQQMVGFLEIFHSNRLGIAFSFLAGLCSCDRHNFFGLDLILSFSYFKRYLWDKIIYSFFSNFVFLFDLEIKTLFMVGIFIEKTSKKLKMKKKRYFSIYFEDFWNWGNAYNFTFSRFNIFLKIYWNNYLQYFCFSKKLASR